MKIRYNIFLLVLLCNCFIAKAQQKPLTLFNVNATQGLTTDTFYFTDASLNSPVSYTWTFSPNNIIYLNGTNLNSKNPVVRLTNITNYSVRLITSNAFGTDTLYKPNLIVTNGYYTPSSIQNINNADGSIGVSKVVLNPGIDTLLNPYSPDYALVLGNQTTILYRGKKNGITITRPSNTTAADFKVWIDYNRNGDFDISELVLNSVNSYNTVATDSFFIPANQPTKYVIMRVAVALNGGTFNPYYATIGVFRDFRINIGSDYIKPNITLNSGSTIYGEINKSFYDPMATAFDNHEGNISYKVQRIGLVDTSSVGNNLLKYFVKDLYNNYSDTLTRNVIITQNQTAPILTLFGDSLIKIQINSKYNEPGYVAYDNSSSNITQFVNITGYLDTANTGLYTLYYTVSDAFNRTTVKHRMVQVIDTIKPIISAKFGNPLTHLVLNPINLQNLVNVTDNSLKQIIPLVYGTVNVNNLGTYNILYKAYDWTGNAADSFVLQIIVADTLKPWANDTTVFRPEIVNVYATFSDPIITYSDNYFASNQLSFAIGGNLNMNVLGNYTRTYTCTDPAGNSIIYTKKITVIDNQNPTFIFKGDNPINVLPNTVYIDPGIIASDNYNKEQDLIITATYSVAADSLGRIIFTKTGLEWVKYTVTDLSNNYTTATRIINVLSVGLNEETLNNQLIKVYPNPAKDFLLLEPKTNLPLTFEVYNSIGEQVLKAQNVLGSNQKIDLSNFKNGVYLLKFTAENNSYIKKFIVER